MTSFTVTISEGSGVGGVGADSGVENATNDTANRGGGGETGWTSGSGVIILRYKYQ